MLGPEAALMPGRTQYETWQQRELRKRRNDRQAGCLILVIGTVAVWGTVFALIL